MKLNLKQGVWTGSIAWALILAGCSSAPKVSDDNVSQPEAVAWFKKYCSSPGNEQIGGSLVVKSSTQEFKGQFPATVLFEKNGTFQIEITNILGGTVALMSGDSRAMNLSVPAHSKYSRSGLTHYLGLEISVLLPLLRGELPCPTEARAGSLRVQAVGNAMKIHTPVWDWYYYRAGPEQGAVPAKLVLKSSRETIEMNVEEWNESERYLRKGHVQSPEGELKWTWRSRTNSH